MNTNPNGLLVKPDKAINIISMDKNAITNFLFKSVVALSNKKNTELIAIIKIPNADKSGTTFIGKVKNENILSTNVIE